MKVPEWLERKILAHPGTVIHSTRQQEAEADTKKPPKPLCDPFVVQRAANGLAHGALEIEVPVKTASEVNGRDWKARSRRSGAAWKAVSKLLGPHLALLAPFAEAYHSDKALKVVFTRLGCHKMDKSNLPSATKAVEDALAFMLGADDGDPRWSARWEQVPEAEVCGVRIYLEVIQ